MPYNIPNDYAKFERLIEKVNQDSSKFSVHVGDFKSGSTFCSDQNFKKIYDYFQTFKNPLIYTPGDNEWTDCHRPQCGAYNPIERLTYLRKLFFADSYSFGKKKILLKSQAEQVAFGNYVENKSWKQNGILFATIHLVGSNNNFLKTGDNSEFLAREQANLAWLDDLFEQAKTAKGLVIFTQADMFHAGKGMEGFDKIVSKLTVLSQSYKNQILWVNGDSHKMIIDKPLVNPNTKKTILNFTRLQVFGENDLQALRVAINPNSSDLFQIIPFYIPD